MIDEIHLAAKYGQRVLIKLKDGESILGVARETNFPNRAKIQTVNGPVWIQQQDIEHVERLVNYH